MPPFHHPRRDGSRGGFVSRSFLDEQVEVLTKPDWVSIFYHWLGGRRKKKRQNLALFQLSTSPFPSSRSLEHRPIHCPFPTFVVSSLQLLFLSGHSLLWLEAFVSSSTWCQPVWLLTTMEPFPSSTCPPRASFQFFHFLLAEFFISSQPFQDAIPSIPDNKSKPCISTLQSSYLLLLPPFITSMLVSRGLSPMASPCHLQKDTQRRI